VPLREFMVFFERPALPLLVEGTGLDLLKPPGVPLGRPLSEPVEDPEMLLVGPWPGPLPRSVLAAFVACHGVEVLGGETNGSHASERPSKLLVKKASRSRSSLKSGSLLFISIPKPAVHC
jgi:hypothetical protein